MIWVLFYWVDGVETAQRHEHLARSDELTMKTCFETAQSRQNDGVALGGVRLSEVVEVLVGVDWLPVLIEL